MILDQDCQYLINLLKPIQVFLQNQLKLSLHPEKISLRKLKQGIDFCGYVILPNYRILRTKTKKRILNRINENNLPSYLGLLKHCNSYTLRTKINLPH